jgi:hypothetical protein
MKRLLCVLVAVALALPRPSVPPAFVHADEQIHAPSSRAAGDAIFLPLVYGLPSPAGTYDCLEYEVGLVWTTEVVTLNPDGSSVYVYNPPNTAVVTGTWVYTPTAQEIGFTGFRWLTATVQLPDRLWASRYVPEAGFEVALSCSKR